MSFYQNNEKVLVNYGPFVYKRSGIHYAIIACDVITGGTAIY